MILGVDHLQIAVADAGSAGRLLERAGYCKVFEERDLFDGSGHRRLFGGRGRSIAYYRADWGGLSIELLDCGAGDARGGEAAYRPFVGDGVTIEGPGRDDGVAYSPELEIECRVGPVDPGETGTRGILGTVAVSSGDPERSERFWCGGLGFRAVDGVERTPRLLCLEQNLFGPRVRLLLEASARMKRGFEFIDDPGCVVLAFLSTDLGGDMARLLEHGGREHGEEIGMRINGRAVTAHFARGPCGEQVELIELGRGAGNTG
jgi:hypothetical protein